jgi:hypothetical protein
MVVYLTVSLRLFGAGIAAQGGKTFFRVKGGVLIASIRLLMILAFKGKYMTKREGRSFNGSFVNPFFTHGTKPLCQFCTCFSCVF